MPVWRATAARQAGCAARPAVRHPPSVHPIRTLQGWSIESQGLQCWLHAADGRGDTPSQTATAIRSGSLSGHDAVGTGFQGMPVQRGTAVHESAVLLKETIEC